ncbi:MAG: TetR/AcrR family transcriptional regulator [Clostridia bacterium]|nr:TetR/AcrR family transcriptional regulator [Clostridia bacterium]
MVSKRESNKQEKEAKLLQAAEKLFLEKGIQNTSVSDIVKAAGVAKGTYYLYFQDKAAIEERLIIKESSKILSDAIQRAIQKVDLSFEERFIYAVDYIIDYLKDHLEILEFINKNLSYAVYQLSQTKKESRIATIISKLQIEYLDLIRQESLEDARIVLSLCIEFLGASIYSALVYEMPCNIDQLRPHIHRILRMILTDYQNNH